MCENRVWHNAISKIIKACGATESKHITTLLFQQAILTIDFVLSKYQSKNGFECCKLTHTHKKKKNKIKIMELTKLPFKISIKRI